jgi:hypothetical protein
MIIIKWILGWVVPCENCVQNACCIAGIDCFFTNCRTHHLLCCGVAFSNTSGMYQRRATTKTTTRSTRIIWNKTFESFSINWYGCEVLSMLHLFSVSFWKFTVLLCSPCIIELLWLVQHTYLTVHTELPLILFTVCYAVSSLPLHWTS